MAAQPSVTVEDVSALPGTKVAVPVRISSGQDISAVQFTLEFDDQLLTLSEDAPFPGDALTDHALGVNGQDGSVTVVLFSASLSSFQESGVLASIIFEVDQGAQDGTTIDLTTAQVEGSDSDGFFVNVLSEPGAIQVGEAANQPAEGENELIFSQIANGVFGDRNLAILMAFVNRTGAVADAEIRFFKSDGTPFVLKLTDDREDSTFTFSVAPGESVFLNTDGSGAVSAGYARLISTAPLGGTLVFTTRDSTDTVLAEAGVGASPLGQHLSIPILFESGGTGTGIALVNPGGEESEITLSLKDPSGVELGNVVINLAAGTHLPQFASQAFPILATMQEFEGSIEVWSSVPLAAVAIKTQGDLLTTFPVVVLF